MFSRTTSKATLILLVLLEGLLTLLLEVGILLDTILSLEPEELQLPQVQGKELCPAQYYL